MKKLLDRLAVSEAAYPGNIGFEEMIWFYRHASDKEIGKMECLLKEGKNREAWNLLKAVTGSRLHDR